MNKFLKSLPYLFFIALFGLALFSFTTKDATNFTVVIDAGHGGKDPGCLGSKAKEKDVALAVALKVGNYIK